MKITCEIELLTPLIHHLVFDHLHQQASWSNLGTQELPALPAAFGANNAAVQVLPPPSGSSSALAYVQSLALPGRACYAGDQLATLATLAVCDASKGEGVSVVPARADRAIAACPLAQSHDASSSSTSVSAALVCFAVSVGHVTPFV